jgi:hypothetical protein
VSLEAPSSGGVFAAGNELLFRRRRLRLGRSEEVGLGRVVGQRGLGVGGLQSILWNRFGRNLRIKPNLVKFKFVM